MTIQDNIAEVAEAKANLLAHCMVAKFEDTGTHYRVIYPDGYFPQGAQASKGMGKALALTKLAEICERHWKASFI